MRPKNVILLPIRLLPDGICCSNDAYYYKFDILSGIFNHIDHICGNKYPTDKYHKDSFTLIPFNISEFIDSLLIVLNSFKDKSHYIKFIDAGCGIGTKVRIAYEMGFDAFGIDINRKFLNIGKNLYFQGYNMDRRLIYKDILKHDYKKYDVIYCYCPFKNTNDNLEKRFEKRVLNQAKIGAFIVNFYWASRDKRFKKIGDYGSIYQKIEK